MDFKTEIDKLHLEVQILKGEIASIKSAQTKTKQSRSEYLKDKYRNDPAYRLKMQQTAKAHYYAKKNKQTNLTETN